MKKNEARKDFLNLIENRRKEKKREKFKGNLLDYLDLVKENNRINMLAHKRLYEKILSYGEDFLDESDPRFISAFNREKTRIYEYYNEDISYCKLELGYNKKPCMPRMINNISDCIHRNNFINEIVKKEYETGRKILILGDRREYLNRTENWIKGNIKPDVVGQYVGGMKPAELRDSQEKDIILGTYSMASEGMDIPKLNTIVLASPKSDVVQSVGRILREKASVRKFHPLVIDFIDVHPNLGVFSKQCDKRIAFYKKSNHVIHVYKTDGSKEKIEKRKPRKKKELHEIKECLILD